MPLMGFQQKKYLDRGVGGWVELYPNYFWIFGIFLTLQSPLRKMTGPVNVKTISTLNVKSGRSGKCENNLNAKCEKW